MREDQAQDEPQLRGLIVVQWLTAAWAVILACLCLFRNRYWFQDDALITLRYARHLAKGHGPVWNLAGAPVEGFSSPLHLLLAADLIELHVEPIAAARGLGFAFHAVLLVFVWKFVRRGSGPMAGMLAAALVAASWPMLLWDLGGLDAVPFAALLAMGAMLTLRYIDTGVRRDIVLGGLLLGLAVFMRPDGAVVAAIALMASLLLGRRTLSRRIVDVLLGSLLCLLAILPWELFRIRYFHTYLPNTFYAKVYGVSLAWRIHSGLHYWRTYLFKAPYFVPLLGIVLVLLLLKRKASRFDVGLWALIAGYGFYLLDCGGDHMPGFRFMVPLIPLFAVALVRGLRRLGALQQPATAAVVSMILMLATAMQMTVQVLDLRLRDTTSMVGEEVGRYINAHWKPGSVVGLDVAGAIPYYADKLTYIDMLGLNDAIIAHRNPVPVDGPWVNLVGHLKGDGASVFARRPDYIIFGGPEGRLSDYPSPQFLGDYELSHSPGFEQQYKPCEVPLKLGDFAYSQVRDFYPAQTLSFTYYQRRDLPGSCGGIHSREAAQGGTSERTPPAN